MTGMLFFSGTAAATTLIALALGYIVCYLAKREDKALKTVGYVIGVFIIALSAILLVGKSVARFDLYRKVGKQHYRQMLEMPQAAPMMPMPQGQLKK